LSYHIPIARWLKGSANVGHSISFAGLGGDARHIKNEIFVTYLLPVGRRSMLRVEGSSGILSRCGGKNPHIADSFSLGLDSFRGFDECGFGPFAETKRLVDGKVHSCKDYLGATKYWKVSTELMFPMGLPEELQFRGFACSDVGTLWGPPEKGKKFLKTPGARFTCKNGKPVMLPEDSKEGQEIVTCDVDDDPKNCVIGHRILDSRKIRMSLGVGIQFTTPVGPVRLTYAIPVIKEKQDAQYRFLFGFSTSF
jgi:outer membrane protein insertion porin family